MTHAVLLLFFQTKLVTYIIFPLFLQTKLMTHAIFVIILVNTFIMENTKISFDDAPNLTSHSIANNNLFHYTYFSYNTDTREIRILFSFPAHYKYDRDISFTLYTWEKTNSFSLTSYLLFQINNKKQQNQHVRALRLNCCTRA